MRKLRESLLRIPEKHWYIILPALGILLRILYLYQYSSSLLFDCAIGPDVQEYYERAVDVLNGAFFSAGIDHHAPLYSWCLAGMLYLAGGAIPLVRAFQLLLNFGGWLLFFLILRRSPGIPRKVSWTFLTLGMLYPVPIFHQSQLIAESILLPLLAGCFYFLFRSPGRGNEKFIFPAGLFAGLAGITHPLTLMFAGFLFLSCCFKRKWSRALLFAVGCALPVLPVSLYNSVQAGRPVPVQAGGGFNFYLGNNPEATGGCYLRPGAEWDRVHAEAAREAALDGSNSDKIFVGKALDFFRKSPGAATKLFFQKAFLVFHPRELISGADPEALIKETPVMQLGVRLTLPLFILAACGIAIGWRRRRGYYGMFYLLLFSMWAAQTLTVCSGRYRTAMIPAVLFFAAVAASRLKWYYTFLILLLGLSIHFAGAYGEAEAASLRGEAAYVKRDFETAKRELEFAAKRIDAPARFDNLLGSIAAQTGDFAAAEFYFRHLTEELPYRPEGWMNLANLFAGDPARQKEAEATYRTALKLTPEYADLHYNFGLFLQQAKRYDEAAQEFAETLRLLPGHAAAANGLGTVAFLSGKPEEALRYFELAARLDPQYKGNLDIARKEVEKRK